MEPGGQVQDEFLGTYEVLRSYHNVALLLAGQCASALGRRKLGEVYWPALIFSTTFFGRAGKPGPVGTSLVPAFWVLQHVRYSRSVGSEFQSVFDARSLAWVPLSNCLRLRLLSRCIWHMAQLDIYCGLLYLTGGGAPWRSECNDQYIDHRPECMNH